MSYQNYAKKYHHRIVELTRPGMRVAQLARDYCPSAVMIQNWGRKANANANDAPIEFSDAVKIGTGASRSSRHIEGCSESGICARYLPTPQRTLRGTLLSCRDQF